MTARRSSTLHRPGGLLAALLLLQVATACGDDARTQSDASARVDAGGPEADAGVAPGADGGESPGPDGGVEPSPDGAVLPGDAGPDAGGGVGRYEGPELRARVSLEGEWRFQPNGGATRMIHVPGAWDMQGVNTSRAVYSRDFDVPSSWAGRRVLLDFDAVNFESRVSVNGAELLVHRGVLQPFGLDVTGEVQEGANALSVDVQAHDILGQQPVYPVGFIFDGRYRGIVWDVHLRAVPAVYIDDAFVRTSVQNGVIDVTYTIVNTTAEAVTGSIQALADDGELVDLGAREVTLEPGSNEVELSRPWGNAHLWSPDDPHLYQLETQLSIGGTITDVHHQRFGFRELWIEGDQFRLNGIRYNLRGESSHRNNQWIVSDGLVNGEERYFGKTRVAAVIERWKGYNFNVVRFHQAPPPPWVWDTCDELGILVINESAMYSYDTVPNGSTEYFNNAMAYIPPWIRSSRNHPSIVINVVENEMWLWGRRFTVDQLWAWNQEVKRLDPTRPTMFEGGWDLRPSHSNYRGAPGMAEIFSYHYANGGGVSPSQIRMDWPADNDYYDYAGTLKQNATPNKPVSHGELLWGDMNRTVQIAHRMMAMAVRAMRYHDFADIRPYQMSHLWVDQAHISGGINGYEMDPEIRELEINSFAPVAAFDVAYDRLGFDPPAPSLAAGLMTMRTIAVYNDELSDETVQFSWEALVGGNRVDGDAQEVQIPLGDHVELPVDLAVPAMPGSTLELHLRTAKGGVERFHEVKTFTVN